jgi:alkylresorcinol/alkylpyrone synthase
MFITGLGTAAPSQRYSQKECWDVLLQSKRYQELTPRSRAILKKVLTGHNGIVTRHLALDNLNEAFELTPDALHARFVTYAPALASDAARNALRDAELEAERVDGLVISTCTGYLCPGLTSYVSERLGLSPDVLTFDLVGQGCVAAFPNLRLAEALLKSGQCERVLSVCVEVCSAAMYFDNDPGVLISACLFGDGAGAAVLSLEPATRRSIQWNRAACLLEPRERDLLRFEQKQGMLRNILTAEVPGLAARHAPRVLQEALEAAGVPRSEVCGWVLHPGGRDILTALRQGLGLSQQDVRWSESVLQEYGNLSSASIYFVLQAAFADSAPQGHWWMSSFGAGFSCHGALLKVE